MPFYKYNKSAIIHFINKLPVNIPDLAATKLLLVGLDGVTILNLQSLGGVSVGDSLAVVEETQGRLLLALSLAEGVDQFLELCGLLDLEENLRRRVGDLDVDVLGAIDLGLCFLRHLC